MLLGRPSRAGGCGGLAGASLVCPLHLVALPSSPRSPRWRRRRRPRPRMRPALLPPRLRLGLFRRLRLLLPSRAALRRPTRHHSPGRPPARPLCASRRLPSPRPRMLLSVFGRPRALRARQAGQSAPPLCPPLVARRPCRPPCQGPAPPRDPVPI